VIGREVTVPAGAWAPGDAIVKPWRRLGGTGANPQWRIPHREGHAHGSRGPSHAAFTWHLPDRNREDPTLIAPLTAEPSMAIKTAEDLFIHELSDIYSAEKQLTKALPRLARAAENPDLATAFETHLEETQGQIERIDQVVEILGIRLKRIKCAAMEGLVEEGKEVIDSIDKGPVRDAALIGGAQKVEHYEIASYGTIAALAKQLGYKDALPLLLETLEEEKATDEKLTLLAKGGGNAKAAQAA
jgi:ferritin-like metal-binding protein YciE